jgi:hypothetical protein
MNQVSGNIKVTTSGTLNVVVGHAAGAGAGAARGVAAALNFPVIKK